MTNKSKYINTEKCRNCGKCCKSFSLSYPKSLEKEDPIMFSEVKRFQMLDTNLIEVIETNNVFIVKFKFPCKYLKCQEGVYSCEIYTEDRPKLCEEYPFKDTTDCPFIELNSKVHNIKQSGRKGK